MVLPRYELAIAEADAFDSSVRSPNSSSPGWLTGLPVLIKDMADVAGLPTTVGDPRRADTPMAVSDLCVQRLQQNGGIVLAKTNVPYMGLGYDSSNPLFGVTRNPWHTAHSTGGSSGGAAAALACGAAWLAHGSDLGGSIRGPSGHCGVVGLRPTPGLIARGGIDTRRDPVECQTVDGPMARDVADCALFLDAMAGAHPEDPLSMPPDPAGYFSGAADPILPKRIGISADLGVATISDTVRAALEALAQRLARSGVDVTAEAPDCEGIADAAYDLRLAFTRRRTSPAEFEVLRPHMPDIAARTWLDAQSLTIDRLLAAQTRQQRLVDSMRRLFRNVDCLIIPANPAPPAFIGAGKKGRLISDENKNWVHNSVLAYAITLSWCPSLSIPIGQPADGLPIGAQIIGPPRSERSLFRFGAALEAMLGLASRLPIEPREATSTAAP